MIARVAHIASVAALGAATMAQAESPALCHGTVHEGWFVNHAEGRSNGFVEFSSANKDDSLGRLYLEHCVSGQVMRAEFDNDWSNPSPVPDHFYDRLDAAQAVTQKTLARELKAMGAQTRLYKSKVESCGCNHIFPDAIGGKAAYTGAKW